MTCTIVWFRRDLRLGDNAAFHHACTIGSVLPVFVLDPNLLFHPETAAARVAFMLNCLDALDRELRNRGARLLIRQGDPIKEIVKLARAARADGVIAHTDSERIVGRVRDANLTNILAAENIPMRWVEPAGATNTLMAYSHWSRQWHQAMASKVLPVPERIAMPPCGHRLANDRLPTLEELGLCSNTTPVPAGGSAAALARLEAFCSGAAARTYYWELSYPSARVTSGLSPYLKFGAITPRQCFQRLGELLGGNRREGRARSALQMASRLRWGCAMHQRFRYVPQLELQSLWNAFEPVPELNEEQEALYSAWIEGCTGYPIVDAAARCLLQGGGWLDLNFRSRAMHASFLSNLCGIDWRYGALHYMRHLIDGDCPIDHYQWAMQAGVTYHRSDAWSRIYHPGQVAVNRCDPHGLFIRRWLPELKGLTNDQLGVPPPQPHYPRPVLAYEQARRQRLDMLEQQRRGIGDIASAMARMPEDLRPFGHQRIAGAKVAWAEAAGIELRPAALDLDALDQQGWRALMSWFSGSGARTGQGTPQRQPAKRQRHNPDQLLFDLGMGGHC